MVECHISCCGEGKLLWVRVELVDTLDRLAVAVHPHIQGGIHLEQSMEERDTGVSRMDSADNGYRLFDVVQRLAVLS